MPAIDDPRPQLVRKAGAKAPLAPRLLLASLALGAALSTAWTLTAEETEPARSRALSEVSAGPAQAVPISEPAAAYRQRERSRCGWAGDPSQPGAYCAAPEIAAFPAAR